MSVYLSMLFASSVLGFFHVLAIGTFGLSLLEFLFLGALVAAVVHGLWLGKAFRVPRRFETGAVVSLLGVVLLSALMTVLRGEGPQVMQSFKTFLHFAYLWGFCMIMLCLPITAEDWRRALQVHFVVAAGIMLFGLYQLPARMLDLPLAWIDITNASFQRGYDETLETGQIALKFKDFYRATSIFSEPSALAGYATATLSMLIVPYFRGTRSVIERRWFFWTVVVLSVMSIFLAFSLTGIVMAGAVLALVMILYPRRSIRKIAIVGAVVLVLIGVADRVVEATTSVSVVELFATRVTSLVSGKASQDESGTISGESITQRTADYRVSFEVWQEHPVTGVGPGNFATSVAGKRHNQPFPSTTIGSVLSELGVVGAVVFTMALLGFFTVSLIVERRWSASLPEEGSALDRIVPFLPFRWLLIILTAFTGNFLVSAYFWFEATFLLSALGSARQALGMDRWREVQLVREGWRSRWERAQLAKGDHGAHH